MSNLAFTKKKKTIQYADERCFIQRGDIMQNTQDKFIPTKRCIVLIKVW